MLSTWPDWLRVVNLVLAGIAFIHLLVYRKRFYKTASVAKKDQWWIWTIISGAIVGLAIDGILRHVPVTYRSLITTLIVATLIQGIYVQHLWPLKERHENI